MIATLNTKYLPNDAEGRYRRQKLKTNTTPSRLTTAMKIQSASSCLLSVQNANSQRTMGSVHQRENVTTKRSSHPTKPGSGCSPRVTSQGYSLRLSTGA